MYLKLFKSHSCDVNYIEDYDSGKVYFFDYDDVVRLMEDVNFAIMKLSNSVNTYERGNKLLKASLDRCREKMNNDAFELYRGGVVSFGRAVELSDMSYHEFMDYCSDKGFGPELSL